MSYKFQENLEEAVKHLKIADHMTYVTLPLVNEKRLLIKIFDEIYKSVIGCINAILNYEFLYKRIRLYKCTRDNLDVFSQKCAKGYDITNIQLKKIKEILDEKTSQKEMDQFILYFFLIYFKLEFEFLSRIINKLNRYLYVYIKSYFTFLKIHNKKCIISFLNILKQILDVKMHDDALLKMFIKVKSD